MQNESLKSSKFDHRIFQVEKLNHPIKREVLVLTDSESLERFICCETILSSLKELHILQNYLNRLLSVRKKFGGILIDYSIELKRLNMSAFYIIKEYYMYHEHTMKDYLDDGTNEEFIDSERLCHVFYQIMHILHDLQDRGIYHGLIGPESILVISPNQYGLQLGSSAIISSKQSYFNNMKFRSRINIAPELFNNFADGNLSDVNMHKNDVFCFAITLLRLTLKQSYQDPLGQGIFDENIVLSNYHMFADRYKDNRLIVTCVKAMLNFNDKNRPDFRKILKSLPAYEKIIEYFKYMNRIKKNRSQQTSERFGTPSFAGENKGTPKGGFISFFDHEKTKHKEYLCDAIATKTHIKPIQRQFSKAISDDNGLIQTRHKDKTTNNQHVKQEGNANDTIVDLSDLSDFDDKLNKNMREFNMTANSQLKEINVTPDNTCRKNAKQPNITQLLKKSFLTTKNKLEKYASTDKPLLFPDKIKEPFNTRRSSKKSLSLNTSANKKPKTPIKSKVDPLFRRSFNDQRTKLTVIESNNKIFLRNPHIKKGHEKIRHCKSFLNTVEY